MILNPEQARAVYDAMCAMNNVGGFLRTSFEETRGQQGTRQYRRMFAVEDIGDKIVISQGLRTVEEHDSQAAFAEAYDLT